MSEIDTVWNTEKPGTTPAGEGPSLLYGSYIVIVLLVCSIFSTIDRTIMSLLVEPMKHDLHLSDTQISVLQGFAVAIFYASLGIPIGRLVDRKRRLTVVACGVALWSMMTALCGTVHSFWQLFVYRMGVGVGDSTLSPSAYSLISDCFAPKRLGVAMGVFAAGMSLGAGLALIIGSEIIHFFEGREGISLPLLGPVYSWQLVFIVVGLPGLLIAVWVWSLREPKRTGQLRLARDAEGKLVYAGVSVRETLAYIRANARTFIFMNLASSFVAIHGYGSGAWIPSFLARTHGLSAVEAGRWMGLIVAAGGTAGILAGGFASDWLIARGYRNGRLIMMSLAGFLSAPFALAYPLVSSTELALWLLVPTYFFASLVAASWAASVPAMMPNQMRGVSAALAYLMVNLIGAGLGPTIIAIVTDYVFKDDLALHYSLSIVVSGALLLSGVFALIAAGSYGRTLDYLKGWGDNEEALAEK